MNDLPLATPEYGQMMKEFFPLDRSPEEHAARYGHNWGCFSGTEVRYRDVTLQAWIWRFHHAMTDPGALDQYREEFLTPEEIEHIRRRQREEW
jgi:hypothetical protein